MKLISQSDSKSDLVDAELLARLGKADVELLAPIHHRGVETQADLAVPKARDGLVECRTRLINTCRGLVKSFGERLPKCSGESFHIKAREHVPAELKPALEPVFQTLERIHQAIRQVLRAGFAAAYLVGLLGLWFRSNGHPIFGVFQVLAAWALRPGQAGGVKMGAPPVLAPLAFVGLGSMGVLACSWRFLPEEAVQSLDSARDTHDDAASKAGLSTADSRALIRSGRSDTATKSKRRASVY